MLSDPLGEQLAGIVWRALLKRAVQQIAAPADGEGLWQQSRQPLVCRYANTAWLLWNRAEAGYGQLQISTFRLLHVIQNS